MSKQITQGNGLPQARGDYPLGVQRPRIGKKAAGVGGHRYQPMRPRPLNPSQQRVVSGLAERLKRAHSMALVPVANAPSKRAVPDEATRAQRQRAARELGVSLRRSSLRWPALARHLRTVAYPAGTGRPTVKELVAAVLHALLAELKVSGSPEKAALVEQQRREREKMALDALEHGIQQGKKELERTFKSIEGIGALGV